MSGKILPEKAVDKNIQSFESILTKRPDLVPKSGYNFRQELGNFVLSNYSSELEKAKVLKNELKEEIKQKLVKETGLQAITHDMFLEQLRLLEMMGIN